MSHLLKLGALTDDLINSIVSPSAKSDPVRLDTLKKSALRTLRHHNCPRTNQFEIERQLDGLEEKFRVYGSDHLADALHDRRIRLEKLKPKWSPEILHLLLELSGRPLSSVKLEDLGFAEESQPHSELPLRWVDLALNDPLLQEESVWENVNFADLSTDDENEFRDTISEADLSECSLPCCHNDGFSIRPENNVVGKSDLEGLKKLRESQFWQKSPKMHGLRVKKSVSDLQAIRELLFMYGGYPTSLFKMKSQHPIIVEASEGYALEHVSQFSYSSLFDSFANQGSAIMTLRFWIKRPQKTPLLQVFQLAIQGRLADLDTLLSKIHLRFVAPSQNVFVSLLSVQQELLSVSRPLAYLAEITKKLDKDPYGHAFRYLEILYDQICTSQMAGDEKVYSFLGKMFFECFRIYLRPIRAWIEEGELTKGDTTFFVTETASDTELTLLWESKFKIRKTVDGSLYAPRFLNPAANKIFTTGKSIIVLKHLNQSDLLKSATKREEPILDFQTVCNPTIFQLAPFPELFETAFDAWVRSKHQHATSILKETLFSSCGLHTSLNALSHIYFLADGSIGSNFLNSIFNNLDSLKESWNNRFSLTEHAQSTFASVSSISSERLHTSVSTCALKYQDVEKSRKFVKALAVIELNYQLLWPIQIVITPATTISYQRIFTFLAQVRRSSYILSRQSMRANQFNNTSSPDEQALYYSIRMRLLWFTQTLYYYLTSLVLDQCSQKMQADLKAAEDVDMMIEVHSVYMKTCIDQALLGSRLELIHDTILRILDLGIKLEDSQAASAAVSKDTMEQQQQQQQQELKNLSVPILRANSEPQQESPWNGHSQMFHHNSQDCSCPVDEDQKSDVDVTIMSFLSDDNGFEEPGYAAELRHMKAEFCRLVKFVARGLKGIARASGGEDARLWDTLGEMFENGLRGSLDE